MSSERVPWSEIDTLFLDAGNTLVGIDLAWVREELREREVECSLEELRRAEARARPRVSAHLEDPQDRSTEAPSTFTFYLRTCFQGLVGAARHAPEALDALAEELASVLRARGTPRLWSAVLPGVASALAELRQAGLRLAVVSNSDGTVEESLIQGGLRDFFDEVHDSHRVGFEKPDPRIFHHALARAGASPARTLHVGDLYAADVVGARAAGVHALLLDPYDDWGKLDCERCPDLPALASKLLSARG